VTVWQSPLPPLKWKPRLTLGCWSLKQVPTWNSMFFPSSLVTTLLNRLGSEMVEPSGR
jgi:hypothetical protein